MESFKIDQVLHTLFAEITPLGCSPSIINFSVQGSNQTDDRRLVWENTNHLCSTFDLLVYCGH